VVPPDLEAQLFPDADPAEAGILAAARNASARLLDLQREVQILADRADAVFDDWRMAATTSPWSDEVRQAEQAYAALVDQLRGAGAGSPDEYGD
jgi:hypothetical protein